MTLELSWLEPTRPLVIGHRGFPSRARENTLESFTTARDAGADGFEFDVWLSGDGVPVVHHDPTALTESGELDLRGATWAEIAAARFRSTAGVYLIASLEEVLSRFGGTCLLNLEIKPPGEDRRRDTVKAVMDMLQSVEPPESILVSSFDDKVLDDAYSQRGRRPEGIPLAYLLGSSDRTPESFDHGQLAALHPPHQQLNPELLDLAKRRGLRVNTWTVNDAERASQAWGMGVTAVITDRPDVVVRQS